MKFLGVCFVIVAAFTTVLAGSTCESMSSYLPDEKKMIDSWVTMESLGEAKSCVGEMQRQVKEEIGASLRYLAMAAHFSIDTVNRPGFAKMFFDAASEERQHAIKLIEYMTMRGENTKTIPDFRELPSNWNARPVNSGEDALKEALSMETAVTNSIIEVIKQCENTQCVTDRTGKKICPKLPNDYHLVDYLTGEFLEEQYRGQKEIADHLFTLNKLQEVHQAAGEFLFDKKLLS